MMKKSQRIKTIVEIKAAQEKKSLEALGASQRKLLAAQAQVESLKKYQKEYQDRFNQLGGGGISVLKLQEFRSFMDKLDKAIAGQQQSLSECETDLMTKRKTWEAMHHRTQSLQKVCNSALAAEIKQDGKLEQLEQDERASRSGKRC
ncbi:MAG: flagellar export protein FliJ [Methylococcales bacterium]|nr:flagellar export protein FliJ [Methylococcales bacterium]